MGSHSKGTPVKKKSYQPDSSGPSWVSVLGLGALVVVVVVFAVNVLMHGRHAAPHAAGNYGTPLAQGKPVDGIHCETEMTGYHIHAHLDINDRGKRIVVPVYIGFFDDTCLYWLHTHDDSGIIHVEAPTRFHPVLGNFFDVWGQPFSRRQVAGVIVRSHQSMKVFVDGKLYWGNPRLIPLRDHSEIAVVIGPPFAHPVSYDFSGL